MFINMVEMLKTDEDVIAELMAKIRELEDENINLTEMNEELDGKDDILRDRMAELEKENEELSNKVEYLEISNRNLRTVIIICNINTYHSISKTCEGLQEENDKLKEENKKLKEESKKPKEELKLICGDVNQLIEEKGQLETKWNELVAENRRLQEENKKLKEELKIVREDNDKFTEDIKQVVKEKNALETKLIEVNKKLLNSIYGKDSAEWNELVAENRSLQERKAFLENQVDILSTTCDRYMDDIDKLSKENEELTQERDALWDQNKYSDKMYNQLMNDKKRLQENFEELKASSDLSMTAELATIFAEFTDKDDKNRADLSVKIDKFKEKYQFE